MKVLIAALIFFLAANVYAQKGDLAERRVNPYPQAVPVSDWPTEIPVISWTAARAARVRKSEAVKPVSVGELLVPAKAAKEVQRSEKAFQSGNVRESAQHLEKAVEIYPDYVYAHNLLGTRYMSLGDYKHA